MKKHAFYTELAASHGSGDREPEWIVSDNPSLGTIPVCRWKPARVVLLTLLLAGCGTTGHGHWGRDQASSTFHVTLVRCTFPPWHCKWGPIQ